MKDNKINTNKLKISKFVYIIVFFMFIIFGLSLTYRTLVDYEVYDGVTISEFITNRNINEEIIMPDRGTIYDTLGNALAQDVSSYTLIAYLDESRSDEDNIRHVVDKEMTAKKLSKCIDTSYERILEILNKDAYQVEFGIGGKNLSQLKMEEIKDLNLPGIDFIKSTKRYYPYGDFASYLLGYTKNKENEDGNTWMIGELGIEGKFNDDLTGETGYVKYEQDARGNKIANSNEYMEDAVDGSDIYLTIDSNIQLFIEDEVKDAQEKSKAEWVLMGVMDAKTGAILGYSSTPSFDPNIRNLTNYMDPLVSYAYEPGSTMKTFSYMCAIDSGKYDGEATFMSGSKTYESVSNKKDKVTIKDWNGKGWGKINFDYGFAMSSNIGVATLLEEVITKQELADCYEKFGFGKITGISLSNELGGEIKFTYDVEAATAGYGQGIMVTPIQILQGMTIVSNDGVMLKPYIVDKIVDANGEVIVQNERTELGKVVSSSTVSKIEELLRSVVVPDSKMGTGSLYYMKDYDLIGKTGTASIYENGKYLTGGSNYIYSFAGLYPGNDPEIIIYMAVKKPKDEVNYIAPAVRDIVVNVSKYLNIENDDEDNKIYLIEDYSNQVVSTVTNELKNEEIKVITLGTGNKIVNQYPSSGVKLQNGDTVVLLTNNYDKTMIDFKGMAYKDVVSILKLMDVEYKLDGYGYAYEQNISKGKKIDKKVEIKFKKLY